MRKLCVAVLLLGRPAWAAAAMVTLTWKDLSNNEDGFLVEKKPAGAARTLAAALLAARAARKYAASVPLILRR